MKGHREVSSLVGSLVGHSDLWWPSELSLQSLAAEPAPTGASRHAGLHSSMAGLWHQGWSRRSARGTRSLGRRRRQERMSERQEEETWEGKEGEAPQMSASDSKGMSPQTMSKRRMPRDQTVASSPL